MVISVKPASSLQQKYVDRATAATPTFVANVAATTKDPTALAVAQKNAWVAALANPATIARWVSKLTHAGAAKWKARVAALGDARYRSGVGAAGLNWASGIQPFFDSLNGQDFGPRAPKGDPSNSAISTKVQALLHAKKLALSGS